MFQEYIHRPDRVKAIQVDGTGAQALRIADEHKATLAICNAGIWSILIPQTDFSYIVNKGDYIVLHEDGQYEGLKEAFFKQEYEEAISGLGYGLLKIGYPGQ